MLKKFRCVTYLSSFVMSRLQTSWWQGRSWGPDFRDLSWGRTLPSAVQRQSPRGVWAQNPQKQNVHFSSTKRGKAVFRIYPVHIHALIFSVCDKFYKKIVYFGVMCHKHHFAVHSRNHTQDFHCISHRICARISRPCRPVATLLITGVVRLRFWTFFRVLKIGSSHCSGCLGETPTFKIIMIDDVILWSKLDKSTRYY